MDLTAEMLEDFLDQARRYAPKHAPEKRKGGRLSLSCTASILVTGDADGVLRDVTIINISSSSVGLMTSQAMDVGQTFAIRLAAEGNNVRWITCKTMRCLKAPNGSHQVGAQFTNVTCTDAGEAPVQINAAAPPSSQDPDMVQLFKTLAAAAPPTLSQQDEEGTPKSDVTQVPIKMLEMERRKSRRNPICCPALATLIDDTGKRQSIEIILQNISTGGIGFQSPLPLNIGSRVAFKLHFQDRRAKAILAEIVSCTPLPRKGFRLGAKMIDSREQTNQSEGLPKSWLAPARTLQH